MADRLSPERRSWNMGQIRGADTQPERQLRSLLHKAGLRFRLHDKKLPGRPDMVLARFKAAVFVHGCFWHRHGNCKNSTMPSTRREFWAEKFDGNVRRDARNRAELEKMGWAVHIVWECDLKRDPERVASQLVMTLRSR